MATQSDTRAFSLPEILVAIAIIATLSVVALPAIMNKLTEARAAALAQTLDGINETVQNYRGNVGRYPRLLSQLSTKPVTGALEVCGGVTPPVNINQWRGPYTSRTFTTGGTKIGDGTILDTIQRNPAATSASSTYGVAYIEVIDVDQSVASLIEESFDGNSNFASGTILWTRDPSPAGPVGKLKFGIPVRGC